MLRTILLGLNGPPQGSSVVELGLRWARRFDAMLVGMGVVDEPSLRGATVGSRGGYLEKLQNEWVGEARHEMDRLLEQFAVRCCQEGVACKLLEDAGSPWEEILKEAQRFDLMMLGQRTHFEAQPDLSRTLSRVLHHASRPVVVVPESPPPAEGGPLLVAYDGSVHAARTLQLFALLGLHALGDVYVLSVDPLDCKAAARTADRAVQYLSCHGIAAQPVRVVQPVATSKIVLEQAAKLRAGLIVSCAYGRTRFEEFFLGSLTKQLLQESPVPLFLYH